MHVRRRRLPNFESCSVALFTSLALGGTALPARSQTPSSPPIASTNSTVPSSTSTVPSTPRSGTASYQIGPTPDSNKDGSISSAEFDEALK